MADYQGPYTGAQVDAALKAATELQPKVTEIDGKLTELSGKIDDIAVAITNEEITEIINMVFGGGGYGYYGVGIGIGDWDY